MTIAALPNEQFHAGGQSEDRIAVELFGHRVAQEIFGQTPFHAGVQQLLEGDDQERKIGPVTSQPHQELAPDTAAKGIRGFLERDRRGPRTDDGRRIPQLRGERVDGGEDDLRRHPLRHALHGLVDQETSGQTVLDARLYDGKGTRRVDRAQMTAEARARVLTGERRPEREKAGDEEYGRGRTAPQGCCHGLPALAREPASGRPRRP